jgi:hypothetical protein
MGNVNHLIGAYIYEQCGYNKKKFVAKIRELAKRHEDE